MSIPSEEDPTSPAGFYPGVIGDTLSNGRWKILRKLGWGPKSLTWLAKDLRADPDTYKAIKIFTVETTNLEMTRPVTSKLSESELASEKMILQLMNVSELTSGVPVMDGYFYETSSKGKHLCLVLSILGFSIETLRRQNVDRGYLPLHITKKIIRDLVRVLEMLHRDNINHNAVTPDNIFLSAPTEAKDIEEYLSKNSTAPPREDGVLPSQPMSLTGCKWNSPASVFANEKITLGNFKYACSGRMSRSNCTIPSPEEFQGWQINRRTNTWMVGYTTYLLLTGNPPFNQTITKQELLDLTNNLPDNLPTTLASIPDFPPSDIPATAELVSVCLQWDPGDRPPAGNIVEQAEGLHYEITYFTSFTDTHYVASLSITSSYRLALELPIFMSFGLAPAHPQHPERSDQPHLHTPYHTIPF